MADSHIVDYSKHEEALIRHLMGNVEDDHCFPLKDSHDPRLIHYGLHASDSPIKRMMPQTEGEINA